MDEHKLTYDELMSALRSKNDDLCQQAADKIEQLQRALIHSIERSSRRAHWVEYPSCLQYDGAYSEDHIVCSNCHAVFSVMDNDTERFNHCPECGADMQGSYVVVRKVGKQIEAFIEWKDGNAVIGNANEAMVFSYHGKAGEIASQLGGSAEGWCVIDVSPEECEKVKRLLNAIFKGGEDE